MSGESLILEAQHGSADAKNQLIKQYDVIFRVCALRFCDEDNFDDFVQEGMLSFLERSIFQYSSDEKFSRVVMRNCLRYQSKLYLSFYQDLYQIFNDEHLIKKYSLCCSLFGAEDEDVKSDYPLTYDETRDLCLSFIESKTGQLKHILTMLYSLE